MKNVGIIILAAGASTRMGRPKQLLPINGQPLLLHTVDEALSASVQDVVVVLGSNAETHIELLETYPVHIVVNESWQNGLGSSIKKGLQELLRKVPDIDGALLMAGDQPSIGFDYLTLMVRAFQYGNEHVVASSYSDTLGIPVLFPRQYFSEILAIDDKHGAKAIINNVNQITSLHCPEGAFDLDTPEDYAKFRNQLHLQ